MTVPRYWPCSKGSRVASPSAISVIGARHEPPSGPRKRACWFSHAPMPRRKSTCWLRCGRHRDLVFPVVASVSRPCLFTFLAWFVEHGPTQGHSLQPLPRRHPLEIANSRLKFQVDALYGQVEFLVSATLV